MDDSKIIELYFVRSEAAVSETYKKYSAYCMTVSFNILRNSEDAEECVNDTFNSAWESIPPNRPENFKAYLGRIARNISLNRLKRGYARKRGSGQVDVLLSELDECVTDKLGVEDEIDRKQLVQSLNSFLDGLAPEKRKVFVNRYWYACSVKEIAGQYGMSEEKVKSMLFRTRKHLKRHLEKEGMIYES